MRKRYKLSKDDLIFEIVTKAFLVIFVVIVFYPLYFVLIASVTDPVYVNSGDFLLYPKGFTLMGYERIAQDDRIITGYGNTIMYTLCGTILGVSVTMLAAYALSRKDLPGSRTIMLLFIFTMYFQGGMIPFYFVVKGLNLVNTRLFMILSGSVSVYNIIIARSFLASNISEELRDAARIDGCGNATFFIKIVVPLSKAVTAVIALYLAVSYWNTYFNAMIFLTDEKKYPLQLFLREILLATQTASSSLGMDPSAAMQMEQMGQVIKYGVIVVTALPVICIYPFIQKYFVKGVMIGSIKG